MTTPPQPRVCILTQFYVRPAQTFVNRHIQHLFGGNTCVIADELVGPNVYDVPVYARNSAPMGPLDRIARPFQLAARRMTHGTSSIPSGADRRAIRDFLRDQNVDLVLGEFGNKTASIAPVAAELGLPCFSYFRGADASYPLKRIRRLKSYKLMVPHLSGMIAVSQFLLDNLTRQGVSHPNSHVIPSGVDTSLFVPGDKVAMECIAVGRLVQKKAPLVTLRAFAKATADLPDARLVFIGDGSLDAPARALANELGITDRVTFKGAQPHEQVRAALSRADVFLQHSVSATTGDVEGMPTSIQEAMASGCVVVSTRHAGIPEAIRHGENGFLSDEHDENGFAHLIRRALTEDTDAIRNAARHDAETRYDNRALLAQLEDVLKKALP